MELKKSQTEIDAVAAENRERFRTRLRENQSRINQAAEARPSLLIRHDQVSVLVKSSQVKCLYGVVFDVIQCDVMRYNMMLWKEEL